MKYLGPVLTVAASLLILLVICTYFTEVLPLMWDKFGVWGTLGLTLLGLWLAFNILFNYISTILMGPGFVPKLTAAQVSRILHDPEARPGQTHRFCNQCQSVKPMRSHHCAICKRCVLKMDHHCPWVNSCVGYRNYKHFYLFLVYLLAGSAFFLCMTGQKGWLVLKGSHHGGGLLLPAVVLCVTAIIASFLFVSFTSFLVFTNRTSIELYSAFWNRTKLKKIRNPYDLGLRGNLRAFFGLQSTWWSWALPDRRPPPGDGLVFPIDFQDGEGVVHPYSDDDPTLKGLLAL
jgi:palmitoyltransferase